MVNTTHKSHYFDGKVSPGFVSLYTGKTIVLIAGGLLSIFLPIFLYTLFGNNIQLVFLFYGTGYLLYVLTVALGAQFLNKFGYRNSLRASVFAGALFYTLFFFLDKNNAVYLIPLSIIVLSIFRLLYWLPYHVDFAKFTDSRNRGRQLSAVRATRLATTVLLPVIAGFLISRFGFDVLFVFAILIFLISGIPYITIPQTNEKFIWGYFETWKKFFANIHHKVLLAYMADGAESVVGLVVWPIFIFQLLEGNYFEIGVLSTLIIGVAVVLQLTVGKRIDSHLQKEKVLKWGSVFYAIGWIAKIFIATSFEIFIAGAYQTITKIFTRTPFDTMTYEMSADEGHYVDEFTVLKEMALNAGRIMMTILVISVSFFFTIHWIFVLAAVAALFMNFLNARDVHLTPVKLR